MASTGNTSSNVSCCIQLRNAIGSIIEIKNIPFVPTHGAMGPYHIVLCNERTVYTWQYVSPVSRSGLHGPSHPDGAAAASAAKAKELEDDDNDDVQALPTLAVQRWGGKERMLDIGTYVTVNYTRSHSYSFD